MTDGGIVVGFLDKAWSRQPTTVGGSGLRETNNSKETLAENVDDVVIGFCALNGASVVDIHI